MVVVGTISLSTYAFTGFTTPATVDTLANTDNSNRLSVCALSSTTFVVSYLDNTNGYGKVVVGTYNGGNSFSFGAITQFAVGKYESSDGPLRPSAPLTFARCGVCVVCRRICGRWL